MEPQEKRMIDGLFNRLRQAESQSGPRDPAAESLIRDAVARQPAAPYYMAQAILVQEHALQNVQGRVEALESRIRELESEPASRPAGGGFLGGLFGAGSSQRPAASPSARGWTSAPGPTTAPGAAPFPARSGSGFLGGALQTAVAVAGGVLVGNAIAGLFSGDEVQAAEDTAAVELEPPGWDEPVQNSADDFSDFGGGDEEI